MSPTRGRFVQIPSTSPNRTQDYAYGLIHLYRDVSRLEDPDTSAVEPPVDEENTLAILAVPSYMTASDFMGFVGERQKDRVSHFRMIRTEAANRYMVLLKFRTNDAAREFHSAFNGKAFNSMEVKKNKDFGS
jgi:BRCA1-associated protein